MDFLQTSDIDTDVFTKLYLKKGKKGKTPGCDGLPLEFYITFWDSIQELLVKVLKQSVINGQLNNSGRRGIISLIPKKTIILS